MKQLLFVHGWNGHPDRGWKLWLKKEVEAQGYKAFFPHMLTNEHPDRDQWVHQIAEIVKTPDASWTLIGHSLGVPAILRYLQILEKDESVGTVILIAGPTESLRTKTHEEIDPFFEEGFAWEKIRGKARHFVVVHSREDNVVPVQQAIELAKNLRVEPILVDGYNHFSADDGAQEIPFLLQQL